MADWCTGDEWKDVDSGDDDEKKQKHERVKIKRYTDIIIHSKEKKRE